MKRLISCVIAGFVLACSFMIVGCGEQKETDDLVDRSRLYGMCYLALEWELETKDISIYEKSFEIMHNMGVKSIRNWMHANWLLDSPTTINEKNCEIMHNILAEAKKYDIQVIGMSHNWFTGTLSYMYVPQRDMTDDSYYVKWLLNYDKSWETLAKEFPEVTLWEIGNELNNDDFIHPETFASEGLTYSLRQKAQIATDMLYYGTRGVKRGNPEAKTIMGGLSNGQGFYNGKDASFLNELYLNIGSGNWPSTDPDEYFDYLAWHPYSATEPSEKWVEVNNELYAIAQKYEKRNKKVYLTEFGYPDTLDSNNPKAELEKNTEWILKAYKLIEENMPYVESMHCFRLFDSYKAYSWGNNIQLTSYGFFNDPIYSDGTAKSIARAFQLQAGGSGSLDLIYNPNPKPNPYK